MVGTQVELFIAGEIVFHNNSCGNSGGACAFSRFLGHAMAQRCGGGMGDAIFVVV